MLLSIKNNWGKATSTHAAYTDQRLAWGKQYFHTRRQMEGAVTALLDGLLSTPDAAEVKQMLDAVAAARKGAVGPGLPTPLEHDAQIALGRALAQLPAGIVPDEFTRHVKRELAEHGNSRSTPDQIRARLVAYWQAHPVRGMVDPATAAFLDAHCSGIGTMDLAQLEAAAAAYDDARGKLTKAAEKKLFSANLSQVFDYDKFCTANGDGWNAHRLCKLSRTRTCPYCNQAYAFTVVRNDGTQGLRPTLDHFFPQGEYPLLAISLNNLIPSCYTCNANLKGKTDFYQERHLHPLYDEEAITFGIEAAGMSAAGLIRLLSNPTANKSRARLKVRYDPADAAAARSAKTFLIQERYDGHLSEALAFALLHLTYDRRKIKEMRQLFKGLSQAQVLQFDPECYQDHLLGKMYAGLFEQFKR